MENLVCPKCKQNYDFEQKLPRLFPNCGHTFCQECIINLLSKKKKKYSCPKDYIKCDPSVLEKGLDYFPVNLAIKNFIQPELNSNSDHTSDLQEDSLDSDEQELRSYVEEKQEEQASVDEYSQQNFCIHHHKKAELVCLTDRKVICSECVMFGIHKTHDYLKPEYFKQRASKDLYDLREKAEGMNPNRLSEQMIEQERNHLLSKVKYKKDALSKEIEKNFKSLFSALEQKQKEIIEELDNHFNKFENSINYINSNLVQILLQEKELFQNFQSLENEIQKKYPDLDRLLDTLYGESSLLKSSQEISQKRNLQTQNTKKLIYENLNKIQLRGNFKKLVDEIRIDINLETQAQLEQQNSLMERKGSFIDNNEKKRSFADNTERKRSNVDTHERKKSNVDIPERRKSQIDSNLLENKNSLVEKINKLDQLDDNLYNDFEMPEEQQEQDLTQQIDKENSLMSDTKKLISQEVSLNVEEDEDEQNILESSIIDAPLILQDEIKEEQEKDTFLKKHDGVKSFRKLSSLGRQPSNKLYQKKQSRKFFEPTIEQKNRKISREMHPQNFVQSNLGYFNGNSLYSNQQNFTQQSSMMMTSEVNVSNVTQKPIRSNTQKKFAHHSQRNFYNPPPHQPKVIKRDFSGRGISESDLDIYVREVLEDPHIKILDLSNNNITLKGFKYLIQKLAKNKSIEFLDLKGNQIDDKAVIILEKYGKTLTTLKKINLQKNKLTANVSKKKIFLDKLKKKGIKINLIL